MMLWLGTSALSAFRLERLNQRLAAIAPVVLEAAAKVYVLDTDRLDLKAQQRAGAMLQAQRVEASELDSEGVVFVMPRIGTISPWSSKATDILRAGEVQNRRVEAGLRYLLKGFTTLEESKRISVLNILHDPMTQSVLPRAGDLRKVLLAGSPTPLSSIELGEDAIAALQLANRELGLALSGDEIEYLAKCYRGLKRAPTDAELMMFAQANSEHCRHKVFNASWTLDGEAREHSLFAMIKNTHRQAPEYTLSAYKDNAAVIEGFNGTRFFPDAKDGRYRGVEEPIHYAIKVETHNHPTAIAPFPGASTGSGGEIRDEGATGRGGKPKAGLTGFTVSHLRIPGLPRVWEKNRVLPPRMASAFEIMVDGPLGGAAFNNEFGRPALLGYFRSFECAGDTANLHHGYDKPIMIAGGLANVRDGHVQKRDLQAGDAVIVLGGPAMLIGLGGGAASSVAGGESSEALDFASVQRDNPEMERRCQEVIDRCWAMGEDNPIVSIHDVGAGGLSNAIPELLNDSNVGGLLELRDIPCSDPSLSPMQIWCNESQERYVLGLRVEHLQMFEALCARERCPYAVVGFATRERHLKVHDRVMGLPAVDLPLEVLFGKAPKMHRDTAHRLLQPAQRFNLSAIDLKDAVRRVLSHPSVASKSFLITIGDRSVGGLCARDQMVGPWQVPVADCAVTLLDYDTHRGEAMAMGERTPLALVNAAASARMAVGEAITNLAAAPVATLGEVRLSANWMAAVSHPGEDAALFDAVQAVGMELCPKLGISIPVGKDSLSMQAQYAVDGRMHQVVSPVSLIVTAFARVGDVRASLTPQLQVDQGDSELWLIDLSNGQNRLGGSILQQCFDAYSTQSAEPVPDLDRAEDLATFFAAIQHLAAQQLLLAYHDRSDGGAFAAACEMAFAGRAGLHIDLRSGESSLASLFNEELGALIQIRHRDRARVQECLREHGLEAHARVFAQVTLAREVRVRRAGVPVGAWPLADLLSIWHETSHAIQVRRDHPDCAESERKLVCDTERGGLSIHLTFNPQHDVAAPYLNLTKPPKVAILREQGVNSQVEMAKAFSKAGFDAIDVHMSDLLAGRHTLEPFKGLIACGGFSYGDVLGAGRGWASSILYHPDLREQFAGFFADSGKFALGVCNGCQMMAELADIIPGAQHWPRLRRNVSEQYEARLASVEVLDSPSLFFKDMQGSRLPVVVAHGEGFAQFAEADDLAKVDRCWRFVDDEGRATETYPLNPNGSPQGVTGFTNRDGRVTILMPHPERVFRTAQLSYAPREWGEDSPWMRMFRNARVWLG